MDKPENVIWKNYGLYKHQIDYLDSIDDNINNAIRKSIDRLIKEDKEKSKHKLLSNFGNSIVIIALGLLFLFFGVSAQEIVLKGFTMVFGLFLLVFGMSFGVMSYKIR